MRGSNVEDPFHLNDIGSDGALKTSHPDVGIEDFTLPIAMHSM